MLHSGITPHLRIAALLVFVLAAGLAPPAATANEAAVIASLENGGSDGEVLQRYAAWLSANPGHADYVGVLERFAALHADPAEAAAAILQYARAIENGPVQAEQQARAAELFEMAGRLSRAQEAYAQAYERSQHTDCRSLLRSALLLFELGRWERTQDSVRELVGSCEDEATLGGAMVLQARLFAAMGRREDARSLVRRLLPRDPPLVTAAALYGFHQVAVHIGAEDLADETAQRLTSAFPDSPEAAMVRDEYSNTVTPPASPSFLLGIGSGTAEPEAFPEEALRDESAEHAGDTLADSHEHAVGIQTGSFRHEMNAMRQRDRLESLGFRVTVEHSDEYDDPYYKVVVPVDGQSSERLIIELKEHGFEGFPLYEDP